MRIVAITRVLNEEDIIEPMIRHHAAWVDHHIVLDNGSTDRTVEIIAALAIEGRKLTLLQNAAPIASEAAYNTELYHLACREHRPDFVLFLDADEFITLRDGADLRAVLAGVGTEHASVGVQLVDYVAPSPASAAELNVARKFRRRREPDGIWKVFVRGFIPPGRIAIAAGNHFVSMNGILVPPLRQAQITLAHFPHRSPWQFAAKAVVGRLKVIAAGQDEARRREAGHYIPTFEQLKADPAAWIAAAQSRFEAGLLSADLIDDPIEYRGGPLRYTREVDYAARAIGHTLAAAENIADALAATLDQWPPARARLDAEATDLRLLLGPRAAGARARYGAILTRAWRSASDPGFAALLGRGWSEAEPWGIWGVGERHELRIFHASPPRSAAVIEAELAAYLPHAQARQTVQVCVQGEALAHWEFSAEDNRAVRRVELPADRIAAAGAMVTLELRPSVVVAPADCEPGAGDRRKLGVALYRLRQRLV